MIPAAWRKLIFGIRLISSALKEKKQAAELEIWLIKFMIQFIESMAAIFLLRAFELSSFGIWAAVELKTMPSFQRSQSFISSARKKRSESKWSKDWFDAGLIAAIHSTKFISIQQIEWIGLEWIRLAAIQTNRQQNQTNLQKEWEELIKSVNSANECRLLSLSLSGIS